MESTKFYDGHLQKDPICVRIQEPDDDDRMPLRRLQDLNFNRAPFANAKTVEEKWKILYRTLFPAEETIPSACMLKQVAHVDYFAANNTD